MKSQDYKLIKYEADEGKVFDWKEPKYEEDNEGNKTQIHLYAKVLYIGQFDSIDNYIEIDKE